MKFNQYSYIPTTMEKALSELTHLGFPLSLALTPKDNLTGFLKRLFFNYPESDEVLKDWIADEQTDLLDFLQSDQALSPEIFYTIALQALEFVPNFDFSDAGRFVQDCQFPILYDEANLILNLYQLLTCRTKSGNSLIDKLVSTGLIQADNTYHFFNGKSLATFDTSHLIREVVYVETPLDTQNKGQHDLVRVRIIRPRTSHQLPVIMTQSPYNEGINDKASDDKLYQMEGELTVKPPHTISVENKELAFAQIPKTPVPEAEQLETFSHIRSYTLNDYMLARGFASIYVSGIGTLGSDGFMTSGDYQQVASYQAVVDWLNGRANAYSSRKRDQKVTAHWASGLVATSGISYLGTLSTGLATTGVEGLKVIIAEAGISSWYDYYRENGLVCSPGGYPGEDLDVLTELTYSRNLLAGDYLKNNALYQTQLDQQSQSLDRLSGDYNQFWHDRNYLIHANKVSCEVIYTHGLQDWNVKPGQVYHILQALPDTVKKHVFLHQGAHVYMNNWQSIDFRETINALLCDRILDSGTHFKLPTVIWQDNNLEQTWRNLETFGSSHNKRLSLGQEEKTIPNAYTQDDFERYGKNFHHFKADLFSQKTKAVTIDFPIKQDLWINGPIKLNLRLKSSTNKGILSAQILDHTTKKGFGDNPRPLFAQSLDNGINFSRENLVELPFARQDKRVVTKGFLNLQNRTHLLKVEPVVPNEWMSIELSLQPTIYQFLAGDTLRLVLYTTDFEHTIRDNTDYHLTVDLAQSTINLPVQPNTN